MAGSLWFCSTLAAFIIGYGLGLNRGTVKTVRLINSIMTSGKLVSLDSRRGKVEK